MSGSNPAAMERQLKKIYDCLNIGCNKKAVQECDRLPKNFRDMTVFKALKSLALIRMYKRRQAIDLLNEINLQDDLDEATLQTMTSCYKESVDVSKIVDLYEAASKRRPTDAEIMAHLFMAYVRVFNFKRQKEIALHMYKNFTQKKRLYSFWAIVSLVMQSQETNRRLEDLSLTDRNVCLSLAEKMCEKMMDDEKTQEEIELYLMILRKQGKHEEEYRFLTDPVCLRITDHLSWYNRRRAYLCLDLKMYSRAFKHYFPTLIQEYPDQIEYYQGLFKSAFMLDTGAQSRQQPVAINEQQSQNTNQSSGTPVKASTAALAECFDIVEKQCHYSLDSNDTLSKDQQKAKNQVPSKTLSRTSSLNPNRQRLLRGPFIARAQLYQTILSNENVLPQSVFTQCKNQFADNYPDMNSILLNYFQSFSKKVICFYDLDYMLTHMKLPAEERHDLVGRVEKWIEEIKNHRADQSAYDFYHVLLNYHMLKHSIHDYQVEDSKQLRFDIAKQYIDLYDENRSLGETSTKTEFLPIDHYGLLAVNSIMTNSIDKQRWESSILDDGTMISLIVMVENSISNSPSNHQLKLILLKLFSLIGTSKLCSEVLNSLDIKHFQIDTLGHLLNPVLYNTGNFTLSRESLETCTEFYAHGIRECFEGLTTSYRDGRFSKIEEISNVLRRLNESLNSIQCALLRGVVANLNATTSDELISACQSFDLFKGLHDTFGCPTMVGSIKDNRDFRVLKSLHLRTNELIQRKQKKTLEDERLWLELRYYLMRSAFIQCECFLGHDLKKNQRKQLIEELNNLSKQIDSIIPKIKEYVSINADEDSEYSFLEPESTPFRWNHVEFDTLVSMVRPLVSCTNNLELTPQFLENYTRNLEVILANLESQISSFNSLIKLKQVLMSLTLSVEFISLAVTSLVSIVHMDAPPMNAINSPIQANSKQSSSHQPATAQPTSKIKPVPQQLINKTEAQLTKLSNLIKSVDPKALLDKTTKLEDSLLSEQRYSNIEAKDGSVIQPLMGQSTSQAAMIKLKEKILDSYCESLKEIENVCRRKVRLLRNRA